MKIFSRTFSVASLGAFLLVLMASCASVSNKPESIDDAYRLAFKKLGGSVNPGEAIDFYSNNFPMLLRYAEEEFKKNPEGSVDYLASEFSEYGEMSKIKEVDPKEYKNWMELKKKECVCILLGRDIETVSKKHPRNVSDMKIHSKYRKELLKLLNEAYDLETTAKRETVKDLLEEVDDLKKEIKRRPQLREKTIEDRYKLLTGEDLNL
jgi:hypothetical protein